MAVKTSAVLGGATLLSLMLLLIRATKPSLGSPSQRAALHYRPVVAATPSLNVRRLGVRGPLRRACSSGAERKTLAARAAYEGLGHDVDLGKIFVDPDSSFSASAVPVHVMAKGNEAAVAQVAGKLAPLAKECKFKGDLGQTCILPDVDSGGVSSVLFGVDDGSEPLAFGMAPGKLVEGSTYKLGESPEGFDATQAAIAWGLGSYKFNRLKDVEKSTDDASSSTTSLVWPEGVDRDYVMSVVRGMWIARDLINLPANYMGPVELQEACKAIAEANGAPVKVIEGAELEQDFPMVHAVGKASDRPPRLVEIIKPATTGNTERILTLVGKGVVFDTGGLDLKPPSAMLAMKKDMGGAAAILGLASMLMSSQLDARLRVLIPIAENSVGGNAFRPSDVLTSRAKITVEVGNTDAEGRLLLADALAWADEEKPEMVIDMATLTGAHRVALGWDLPGLFTNDDAAYNRIAEFGEQLGDPVWRLPLYKGYESYLKSKVADTSSTGSKPLAGAVTAALFLKKFVRSTIDDRRTWLHVDFAGWTDARPGRPEGGEPQCILALYAYLMERFGS